MRSRRERKELWGQIARLILAASCVTGALMPSQAQTRQGSLRQGERRILQRGPRPQVAQRLSAGNQARRLLAHEAQARGRLFEVIQRHRDTGHDHCVDRCAG